MPKQKKPLGEGLKRWMLKNYLAGWSFFLGIKPQTINFDAIYEPHLEYWEMTRVIDKALEPYKKGQKMPGDK